MESPLVPVFRDRTLYDAGFVSNVSRARASRKEVRENR